MKAIEEFKPAIYFLLKFVGLYFALNLAYVFYIDAYLPGVDPVTEITTMHSSYILNLFGEDTHISKQEFSPRVYILKGEQAILSVYEGCNSLNVIIVFLSFLFAFSRVTRKMLWFLPLSLLILYFANLARIMLLFYVSLELPDLLYYSHKYLFTAFIYIIVVGLWFIWIRYLIPTGNSTENSK